GEKSRKRKFAAIVGRDLRLGLLGAADIGAVLAHAFEAQHMAGEDEGVAVHQLLDEIFLELAEHAPAGAGRLAARLQADLHHRLLDDDAGVQAVLLREAGMGEPPQAFGRLAQARITVIALERIAAGGDEFDRIVEILARQMRIRRCRTHLGVKRVGIEHAMPSTCCASTSRPPRFSRSPSSSLARTASRAALHSRTSNRLAGTSSAWLGSSSR